MVLAYFYGIVSMVGYTSKSLPFTIWYHHGTIVPLYSIFKSTKGYVNKLCMHAQKSVLKLIVVNVHL